MKRLFLAVFMAAFVMASYAVPAKRGVVKTLKLVDGTEVTAQLVGDETMHYFVTDDGKKYVAGEDGLYREADMTLLNSRAAQRRSKMNAVIRQQAPKRVGGVGNVFSGKKKGLIILVQFSNKKFQSNHDNAFYQRVANEPGFTTDDGFRGSVSDYFKDQSNGMFELDFDVVGPVTLTKTYSYYGQNNWSGDAHPGEMVAEACLAVDSLVNFADYDWAGDGMVDQVFVLYAGLGEASGGGENTVWPHMWNLYSSDYGRPLTLDGVMVNTYACSCEMTKDYNSPGTPEVVDGIGSFCHEFSHCLGYPDIYDANRHNFGMSAWDLMDYGNYNGDSFVPSGYTAYEKWVAGWLTPVELTEETEVNNLKPTSEGGDAYIIYNDNHKDEFYILENRQRTGWDAAQYGDGLLIMHVDYNKTVWNNNTVNTSASRQRCTIFHADNSDGMYNYGGGLDADDLAGDPYPYEGNNSLSNTSTPKAVLYNTNTDGSKLMNKAVYDITRNDDGTVSFKFKVGDEPSDVTPTETEFFHETFNECNGTGGNDRLWSGSIASSALVSDVAGWTGNNLYGGDECMRIGNSKNAGIVTSPEFEVQSGAVLTIVAAPWSGDDNTLDIYFGGTNLGTYTFEEGKWSTITIPLETVGTGSLEFIAAKRFFIDDVRVYVPETDGIDKVVTDVTKKADNRVYSIDGRYLGHDINSLGHGIYIVNGKKYVK